MNKQRVPVTDKNGKQTHVWKRVGDFFKGGGRNVPKLSAPKFRQLTVTELKPGDVVQEGRFYSAVVSVLPAKTHRDMVNINLANGETIMARENETVMVAPGNDAELPERISLANQALDLLPERDERHRVIAADLSEQLIAAGWRYFPHSNYGKLADTEQAIGNTKYALLKHRVDNHEEIGAEFVERALASGWRKIELSTIYRAEMVVTVAEQLD